ncbi:MAG: hypothetical protein Q7N50_00840 [Armatimonadota bacterium]|nr:hypothetical protein [Armatimonadota bacterium]
MSRKLVAVLVLMAFVISFSGVTVYALDLGDVIKVFGIAYAVRVFSGQINSFINNLLNQKGIKWEGTTKVVPIISIGSGTYLGAAQVAGDPSLVNQTKAVGQGELNIGDLRGKLLVPMQTTNPLKGLKRVEGIGVTAVIDFRI